MEEFSNTPEPLISFRDADIMNTESTVIYGLNLNVYQGDLVYIVGKVGTGKTSIIRTLIAENKLGKGSCRICGYEIADIKDRDIPCCLWTGVWRTTSDLCGKPPGGRTRN